MKQPEPPPEDPRHWEAEALEAARQVASYDWGTSVSEIYHNTRMVAMDRLREAMGRLKA